MKGKIKKLFRLEIYKYVFRRIWMNISIHKMRSILMTSFNHTEMTTKDVTEQLEVESI